MRVTVHRRLAKYTDTVQNYGTVCRSSWHRYTLERQQGIVCRREIASYRIFPPVHDVAPIEIHFRSDASCRSRFVSNRSRLQTAEHERLCLSLFLSGYFVLIA